MTERRSIAMTARLDKAGRIVIPAAIRQTLGIEPGDEVVLKLEDDRLRVISRKQALRNLQDMVARVVPPGVSLVDELIEERREEARAEK